MYFNYHAKIRKLINDNELTSYKIVEDWNGISPALVLFFKNHRPMPIRENKWGLYQDIIKNEKNYK